MLVVLCLVLRWYLYGMCTFLVNIFPLGIQWYSLLFFSIIIDCNHFFSLNGIYISKLFINYFINGNFIINNFNRDIYPVLNVLIIETTTASKIIHKLFSTVDCIRIVRFQLLFIHQLKKFIRILISDKIFLLNLVKPFY